ncbi:hypothetical protein D3C76_1346840 [compost metagenome]
METGDLLFAVVGDAEGFQRPRANGEDGAEHIALAEQEITLLQRTTAFDNLIQRVEVVAIEGQRKTQGGQAAVLAMRLRQRTQLDGFGHGLKSLSGEGV